MLVLARELNERIRIGDDIIIEVVRVQGDRVYLGVEAPKHIPVDREEIWYSKRQGQPANNEVE